MSEELKPCPCGGPLYTGEYRFDVETQWCVGCMDCDRNSGKHADKPSAIAAWNRRASPTPEGEGGETPHELAQRVIDTWGDGNPPIVILARALLSSPRVEVREMREALIQARQELWEALHSHMSEAEFNKEVEYIDAALSLQVG